MHRMTGMVAVVPRNQNVWLFPVKKDRCYVKLLLNEGVIKLQVYVPGLPRGCDRGLGESIGKTVMLHWASMRPGILTSSRIDGRGGDVAGSTRGKEIMTVSWDDLVNNHACNKTHPLTRQPLSTSTDSAAVTCARPIKEGWDERGLRRVGAGVA